MCCGNYKLRDRLTAHSLFIKMNLCKSPSVKKLIEQDYVDVAVFRKSEGWQPTHYFLGEEVLFESIDLTLSVEAIYHRVVNQDITEYLQAKAAQ